MIADDYFTIPKQLESVQARRNLYKCSEEMNFNTDKRLLQQQVAVNNESDTDNVDNGKNGK